ncbi:MAG: methionyl-tRNA formyltransferase, partial [Phycisphaerales bacterium]
MRVVYFGSGAFGVPTLRALAERHEVLAVVTQPDRPAGRGKGLSPTPIAADT